jgi:hypothetical protein
MTTTTTTTTNAHQLQRGSQPGSSQDLAIGHDSCSTTTSIARFDQGSAPRAWLSVVHAMHERAWPPRL